MAHTRIIRSTCDQIRSSRIIRIGKNTHNVDGVTRLTVRIEISRIIYTFMSKSQAISEHNIEQGCMGIVLLQNGNRISSLNATHSSILCGGKIFNFKTLTHNDVILSAFSKCCSKMLIFPYPTEKVAGKCTRHITANFGRTH